VFTVERKGDGLYLYAKWKFIYKND
jgi:hypothetical protein